MSRILVVAEHDGTRLNPATAKTVACAQALAPTELVIALYGQGLGDIAAHAAKLHGVTRVLPSTLPQRCGNGCRARAADRHARCLFHSRAGALHHLRKDLLPRVAALLDVPAISDIMAVESPSRFRRPIYAGNAIVTVEVTDVATVVATVRTASFTAVPSDGSAPIETPPCTVPAITHTRLVERSAAKSDRPDLQTARRVVSGGRALGSAEKFQLVQTLADALGAAVGASRAAVDAGYAPNELQVGQTGKIIAPELYIALGISGAIQHMTGIKDARTIVAINKDADAPIFESADIGLVGDLFEVVPALSAALQSRASR